MALESHQPEAANRTGLRRFDWMTLVRSPAVAWNVLSIVALAGCLAVIALWASRQSMLAEGQVLNEARVARVVFNRVDEAATQSDRQAARLKSPRVYVGDAGAFEELRASLENLPRSLADAAGLDQVDAGIRSQFALRTEETLGLVRAQTMGEESSASWRARVAALDDILRRTPLVDEQTFQRQSQAVAQGIELRIGDRAVAGRSSDVTNVEGANIEARLRAMVSTAGFAGPLAEVVTARVRHRLKPTFTFDASASDALATEAADAVKPRQIAFQPGQVLATAGERLSGEKIAVLRTEAHEYRRKFDVIALLAADASLIGMALLAALGVGAYTATYGQDLWRSPARMAALAGMLISTIGGACWLAAAEPRLLALAATAPTLLFTFLLAVAYDRRTALATGSLAGIFVCAVLDQPIATIAVALAGVWVAIWQLREFRQRDTLIRAGLVTGAAVGIASLLVAGLQRPLIAPALSGAMWDAASAAVGALLVGFITLGLLPTLERLFDVATGMSLIELRDPKQPLLRMLQERAPGTYNHSLTVASLCESAAEAIKADGLLTYVGALYHDIGKSVKPEYFVENQAGGPSRHDRLSPAMSLLVIVGHVREGLELAREHSVPKALHHFIESHHGTTLVEYFYHRARKQAEMAAQGPGGRAAEAPQEIEYRYSGPKPRTREAAILMICDASESATRALADPTPARIDSLVRAISHKRLMDGQFDASDLTMRDLSTIVDTVAKSLAAIHHQRIHYPEPASGPRTTSVPTVTGSGPGTASAATQPLPAAAISATLSPASPATASAPAQPVIAPRPALGPTRA